MMTTAAFNCDGLCSKNPLRALSLLSFLLTISVPLPSAELTPAAKQAFDHYSEQFEARWKQHLRFGSFLTLDSDPAQKSKVRKGEPFIKPRRALDGGQEIYAPDGMIQDWLGAVFLPQANIEQVRSVMQDYANYPTYFKPEVTESKLIGHHGDDFEVFLRLYKKQVVTAVLNATYAIHYGSPGPGLLFIVSHSTRIAEVVDPNESPTRELPPGRDNGYLWALNSYWRFEEADGGVYAECEAISLSRDVPFGLGWALKGFLDKFPKESMQNTLAGVKRAVARRYEREPGASR